MSLKPLDSESNADSLESNPLVSPVADKLLKPVASLTKSVQALQSGQMQNALTEGLSTVGQFNKNVAKALGAAKLIQKAASAVEGIGKKAANSSPSHVIADHPLTGSAINDFAVKTPPFAPIAAKVGNSGDGESETTSTTVLQALSQEFSDETRLLRFYSALPADIALYVEALQGHAGLSDLFSFELTLLSKDAGLELKNLMGKNVSVGIQQADGGEHYINGYINSFAFTSADGGFAFYKAEIVPWLGFLKRRVNSRIFQNKNVIDVLKTVFTEDYPGLADSEFRTQEEYKPESYIVQYHESDQNFVCRLLEKNGLFYFFEHGPSGHKMVIADKSPDDTSCKPHERHAKVKFNAGNRTHDEDAVAHIAAQRTLQPSKVALNTFNYKAPLSPQYVELPTDAIQGDVPMLEVYDGTPAFGYKDVGDGMRQARQKLEVLEWQAKVFKGTSDCRALEPGRTFILTEQELFDPLDESASDFLVLSVNYTACNNYFHRGGTAVYSNSFTCIRRKIPFRPGHQHVKPTMPGPQTATVVGPKGTEIHTDKYGRIKVQFHWDRYGRNDEASSCWIRVSQPWAGQGWGTVAIPRVGQEVIIDYLEGDPDRPVCAGRLYNENQPLPYALPGAAHVMGFKSRSTPGGGGYCEMVIHDKKGQELVNIHSQKDMVTTVQNNQTTVVNGPNQTNTVTNGFHVTTVKKKVELESQTEFIHLKAATGITLEVGASKIHMDASGKITIEGVHVDVIGSARIDLNTNSGNSAPNSSTGPESKKKNLAMEAKNLTKPVVANGGKAGNKKSQINADEVPELTRTLPVNSRTSFKQISKDELLKIMPMAGASADLYLKPLNDAMKESGIDTASRQAAFLAQIAVESNQLKSVEENLNYSAARLTKVWPTRFPNLESTEPYVKNARALANFVYANRMGNGSPNSGDGYRYRGRGLIQITGKNNYRIAGFEDKPDALIEPEVAASTAAKYWQRTGLNKNSEKFLQRDEFDAISRVVNGGAHGAEERWAVYTRAKTVLTDQ